MPKRRCCCERQCLCTLTVHVREPRVSPRPLVIGALAARSQSCLPQKRYPVGLTTVVPQNHASGRPVSARVAAASRTAQSSVELILPPRFLVARGLPA
jgi:hypothetical protein